MQKAKTVYTLIFLFNEKHFLQGYGVMIILSIFKLHHFLQAFKDSLNLLSIHFSTDYVIYILYKNGTYSIVGVFSRLSLLKR